MRLSEHFTLEEFIHSQTASRLGIINEPNEMQGQSMIDLCVNVLERIRERFGKPVVIDSGFRSEELNNAVPNSSKSSQHTLGQAADIVIPGVPLVEVFLYIKDNLKYDQVIFELTWVHVSYKVHDNRMQALRAIFDNGKVHYADWKD